MDGLNLYAIIVAAIAAFILGAVWYARFVFGGIWVKANGSVYREGKTHNIFTFIIAFVFYFISAFAFAALIGPQPELTYAIKTGAEIGIFFVATSFGINYLFAGRSYKLFLIDSFYHLSQFIIYGVVLGLWK